MHVPPQALTSQDEARAQLDTAIDWARYAELFENDAARGELTLPDFAETEPAN
jgi:hypothetical protein